MSTWATLARSLILSGMIAPAGAAQAADLWVDRTPHGPVPTTGASVPYPSRWGDSWSWETGQVPTAYVEPAYSVGLPTGYAVTRFDGAPPYCAWITRRSNGYGGRILVWPVASCGPPR
jgi:hypothetical protein